MCRRGSARASASVADGFDESERVLYIARVLGRSLCSGITDQAVGRALALLGGEFVPIQEVGRSGLANLQSTEVKKTSSQEHSSLASKGRSLGVPFSRALMLSCGYQVHVDSKSASSAQCV